MGKYDLLRVCNKRIVWENSEIIPVKLILTRQEFDGERFPYKFNCYIKGELIFNQCDIGTPCALTHDSNDTPVLMRRQLIDTALSFVTLRKGDTDEEFFSDYTPAMLQWIDSWECEQLGIIPYDMESGNWNWAKNTFCEEGEE